MILAALVFFSFVVLGALLKCVEWTQPARPRRRLKRWVYDAKASESLWNGETVGSDTKVDFYNAGEAFDGFFVFGTPAERFARYWKKLHGEDAVVPQLLLGPIGAAPRPGFDGERLTMPGPDQRVALVKWPDGRRELVPWSGELEPRTWAYAAVAGVAILGLACLMRAAGLSISTAETTP